MMCLVPPSDVMILMVCCVLFYSFHTCFGNAAKTKTKPVTPQHETYFCYTFYYVVVAALLHSDNDIGVAVNSPWALHTTAVIL